MLQSEELKSKLEEVIKEFADAQPFTSEVKLLIDNKFRLEFNYNSNHLEGNTLTYTETELLLRFDKAEGNHDYREYQEMQAHDMAFLMIETEAKDDERHLTESFIRTLNQTLLVKPYWKDAITPNGDSTRKQILPGEYKLTPNSVRLNNGEIFHYTAPADVANEMNKLVDWLNRNIEKEDPVTLAATLHYKFVRIHPFDDGNGRTARLLMNYLLLKFDLPVVIIKSEGKKEYLSALHRADAGDMQYFIDYIGNQLLWSLDIQLKASRGQTIEEDDDIEKELALLRRKLATLPDEFDKIKDPESLKDMILYSIFPLYDKVDELVYNLSDLFVSTKHHLFSYSKSRETGQETAKIVSRELSADSLKSITTHTLGRLSLYFELSALKKATKSIDFTHRIVISLEKYHYSFVIDDGSPIIRLPYGRFLTNKDIKAMVSTLTKAIIKEIKEATNTD